MICIGCGESKTPEDFPLAATNRSGRSGRCRACTNLKQREQKAAWGRRNRAKKTEWQRNNVSPETAKRYRQATYYKDLEASRERGRLHRSHYRARIRNAPGTHTSQQWRDLCLEHDHCCVYCGERTIMTRDHVIPLSKGGSNDISNIVPACLTCNLRKSDRLDFVPMSADEVSR